MAPPLPTNHRQKVENMGKLVIHDVQRSVDEGFYTCEVVGPDNKRAEGKMHMRVLVAPVIETVMLPEVLYAKEGTKTKVMCSVIQGDPPVQISWRKMVPPRWKIEPFNSFAVVGKTVIMKCLAEGYPTPRMYWKKATGAQPKDFRDVLSSYRRQVFDNGTLALQEVTESDGGHYLCQATNGIGAGLSKVIHLTIHTPPKFEAKFVSYTVPKDDDAELKCEAEGELPMRFEWEKDKQHLDPQNVKRYALSAVKDSGPQSAVSKLVIKGASRSDSALYTCTASNEFGTDQTNIQLVVQEPPSPPVELNVKEKSSRSVTLSWSPTFSGNSPVTKYIIQYANSSTKDSEDDLKETAVFESEINSIIPEDGEDDLKETVVSGSEINSIVGGLLPASSYKFRILAENVLGISDPSEFITITTEEEVPGAPPLEVTVQPTGSQSLKAPRKDLQHGKIHGYYIGYKVAETDDQFQYKNVEATDGQELSYLTNLRRLTKYKVIVQAYNNIGAGPRSDEVSATTLEAEYILHYKTEGGGDKWKEQKLSTSGNQYTLESLRCGTGYRLYMTATNSLGMGEPSEIITARTKKEQLQFLLKRCFYKREFNLCNSPLRGVVQRGCSILHYSVHFRFQGQWKVVAERVDASQPQMDVRHLAPAREYTESICPQ
ncbi:down syndrome cell adhesion molecule homolog [Caerostris extrusa]|uniref:Down syndrome cell adhesion molecule homolog n=1 Tax=Caerostris extrusa TaxID=172846 RepID=A0AAV4XYB3_CAEEX|nr:down syndrome cell adhesion molecule homolog [Caerostris extrusa]